MSVHFVRGLLQLAAKGGVWCMVVAGSGAALAQTNLPLRNLWVSVRVVEASQASATAAQVSGGFSVSTLPGGQPRGGLTVSTGQTDEHQAGQQWQRVQVLNGARASVGLGRSWPIQWVQVTPVVYGRPGHPGAWSPQVEVGTAWVETGHALDVQPRWPGGSAPVQVEVRTASRQLSDPGQSVSGGTRQSAQHTTVAVPLGEWVTLAQVDEQAGGRTQGTWQTGQLSAARQQVLQLKVSLD